MKVKLDFGAEIDVLTKGELDQSLDKTLEKFRQYATGLKYVRPSGATPKTPTAGLLTTVPQGYHWGLCFAAVHVSAAATVSIGRTPTAGIPLAAPVVLAAAGLAVFAWSSKQQVLAPGDPVIVTASAGNIGAWTLNAVEVPAEQIFKLLGG